MDIIEEHILIRETIGYETLNKIDVCDIPTIISFLRIIDNYVKMKNKIKNENIS